MINASEFIEILLTIMNIIIVPIISVGYYYKMHNLHRKLDFVFIVWWSIFIILDFLLSKIIYECIYIIFDLDGYIYSFQYCLIAFIMSLISPHIVDLIKERFSIELIVNKNEKKK